MVKGEYVDKILNGVKRATIRIGVVKPKYKDVIIHGGGRPIAKARIDKVIVKSVGELTDEDALIDGFRNRMELIRALKNVYGDIDESDKVTVIVFTVTRRIGDDEAVEDPYSGLEPGDIARIALRYLRDLNEGDRRILQVLTQTNSIRRASIILYGSIEKRWIIRRVLRRVYKVLVGKGIL